MFTDNTIRLLIAGALLLHGVAHAIALGALLLQGLGGASATRLTARSWLFPSLQTKSAALLALPFWAVSTLGFLAASLSYWGALLPGEAWRQLAVGGAIISTLGVGLFSGTWPGSPNPRRSMLNTFVALAMNAVILGTQLWLSWP